ncbi:queuine tRNA-ribosyltransferase [Spirochaeta lutea]|uniref:Queuine tRNA-ribosyltransferase n=1 Tax=Spirochaeta lutea TaxID=1480694 RepID=A0A098R5E5_9SPIO|nr:queuine tRNA-ribosyltransferase [Spirochaeta lutea]
MKHRDEFCQARRGEIQLPHGRVQTPVFMPVGTQGTVKALSHQMVEDIGFEIILGNTYHLYLRPGTEVIADFGGLHEFSTWNRNILTDSGGFQVFSLSPFRKITDEGVQFRSHIDGSKHMLTPESVVEIQRVLGSDIQMVLDVCTEHGIDKKSAHKALTTTTRWAKRAKDAWQQSLGDYRGAAFGIVQGNFFEDLRAQSAQELSELDFPGYAIGGLSVGEPPEVFEHFLHYTAPLLPTGKPKYVMGIGTPDYILSAVEAGIDMFDCVFPTRVARNGYFFSRDGRINIKNERYRRDTQPIDLDSPISMYSRAYLRHLFKAGEMLGPMLATRHNLWFLHTFMTEIRTAIEENRFLEYKNTFLERYGRGMGNTI